MCKGASANVRRAALGEITNLNATAATNRKEGPSKKPSCAQKPKPAHVVASVVQTGSDGSAPISANVSMKVEQELCQSLSELLLPVQDVDEQDADQPQLCSQYVKDIHKYLHILEVHPVSRRKLQLVGVTAMYVACKYEERYSPEVEDFAYITDNTFTKSQIVEMEQMILKSLGFQLGRPLPLHFLRRATKVASSLEQQYYSTYEEQHLNPIMQRIAKNVVLVNEGRTKFLAVKNKYSISKLMKISLIPQLNSSTIKVLADALQNP